MFLNQYIIVSHRRDHPPNGRRAQGKRNFNPSDVLVVVTRGRRHKCALVRANGRDRLTTSGIRRFKLVRNIDQVIS